MNNFVPVCVFMLVAVYAGFIYLLTPKGRSWVKAQWRVSKIRHFFVKPEQCDGRADSLLRAQRPQVTFFLARLIAIGAIGCCYPMALQAWSNPSPCGKVILFAIGIIVAKFWTDSSRAVEDIRKSPWMSAQRLIDK